MEVRSAWWNQATSMAPCSGNRACLHSAGASSSAWQRTGPCGGRCRRCASTRSMRAGYGRCLREPARAFRGEAQAEQRWFAEELRKHARAHSMAARHILSPEPPRKSNERSSWREWAQGFPHSVQIRRSERAIVQAVAGAAGFAPDHPSMIRTHRSIEAGFDERAQDIEDVHVAEFRRVWHLVEGSLSGSLNIAAMDEMNALHRSILSRHRGKIIGGRRAQWTGAESDTICRTVCDSENAVDCRFTRNDPGNAKKRPRGIVRMNRQLDSVFFCNWNDVLEKAGEVVP